MAETILTPITMWSSFDDSLPLKEVKLNTFTLQNATYTNVYFSGRQVGANRVRIYGLFVQQKTNSKGSILVLPDVCDKIDGELVNHFAMQGYDVLAVDLRGENEEGEYTKYPEEISYANYVKCKDTFEYAHNLANQTCWYEWTAVARYAVSYLKSKNPSGIVGVIANRYSANVLWQLSATDKRVDCAVFLFGAGWLAYKGVNKYEEAKIGIELNEERYRFIAGIEAQSYATYVTCPVLFLGATNSETFDAERSVETLLRLPNQDTTWFNFITIAKDVLDENCLKDVDLFFLKFIAKQSVALPKTPQLEIESDEEEIIYNVDYYSKNSIDAIHVLSSSNVYNTSDRVWYNVTPIISDSGKYIFKRKAYGNVDFEIAFAIVKYKNGFTISSKFNYKKLNIKSLSKTPSVLFSSLKQPANFIVENIKTELLGNAFSSSLYSIKDGPFNIKGIYSTNTLTTYAVRKIVDTIDENSFLKFDVASNFSDTLKIEIKLDSGEVYVKEVALIGGDFWQNVQILLSDFKDENAKSMREYNKIISISVSSLGAFIINNFILL